MTDLRFAFRQVLKNPGFTAVAVLTLALGIGANTAIFSLVNAILFKPIIARDPSRLVTLFNQEKENPANYRFFSYPNFKDIQAARQEFEDVLAYSRGNVGVPDGDLTRQVGVVFGSANYFSVLGVSPWLGRGFLPEEEMGSAPVAVMSHAYWQKRGGDPGIIGSTVRLNKTLVTVIGVMPEGFTGTSPLEAPAFFLPLGMRDSLTRRPGVVRPDPSVDRSAEELSLVARRHAGTTSGDLEAMLSTLSERLAQAFPAANGNHRLISAPLARLGYSNRPDRGPESARPLAAFALGMALCLLLVACLNLANLMLARGSARRREMAIRLAVGAGRWRVVRQMLTEGLLLAVLGGVAGLMLSVWATDALAALAASGIRSSILIFDPVPDIRVLGASLAFCALAILVFALGPAWRMVRIDVNSSLKASAFDDSGAPRARLFSGRYALVVCQIAFSLALLVTGGMFVRSAKKALDANPGFVFGSNFYAALDAEAAGYDEPRGRELFRRAVEAVRGLPGVEGAAIGLSMPFGNAHYGGDVRLADDRPIFANYNVIGTDYFRTLGIPLLAGRDFMRVEVESTGAPPVVIISQSLATRLWPEEDPLGRRLELNHVRSDGSRPSLEVVAVVPDLKPRLMERRREPFYYLPLGQDFRPALLLQVRTTPGVDPALLMRQTREELRRLEPQLPVSALSTLKAAHQTGMSVGALRIGARIFGAFGVTALLLAAVGLYGVKAYSVSRRTREIGVRMSLGAATRDVIAMVLWEGARVTGWGVGFGLALAWAAGRLASGFLYDVGPVDYRALSFSVGLLVAAALLACWLPARRAAKVDPMEALRCE